MSRRPLCVRQSDRGSPNDICGVKASLGYLNDLAERESWLFEGDICVALIANLAEALEGLAVAS